MLTELNKHNEADAVRLLSKGLSRIPPKTWQQCIDRLHSFGGNLRSGIPYGYLLEADGDFQGVLLTPALARVAADGSQSTVVNMSSWYVEPAQRWQSLLMIRQVIDISPGAITNLTPTQPVQEILMALGFTPINNGVSLIALPLGAILGGTKASIELLSDTNAGDLPNHTRELLQMHSPFGCRSIIMESANTVVPIMYKRRSLRGIAAAQIIYCEDNRALVENLNAVAKFLLAKGMLVLILDIPVGEHVPGIKFQKRFRRFVRGTMVDNTTDYTGSELSLFDF